MTQCVITADTYSYNIYMNWGIAGITQLENTFYFKPIHFSTKFVLNFVKGNSSKVDIGGRLARLAH